MTLKVYISVDMEGVSGVVHKDHTSRDGDDYQLARRLMTLEATAAIEGAFDAKALEVVVNDSHGTMRNLIPELLDPRAQLITGSPKPLSMMQGIDDTFSAAICIGYHARAGTSGILDHTMSGRAVYDLRINGKSQGEFGLNSGIAGYFGVPMVMISGDSTATSQATDLVPDIATAAVKEAVTRYSAKCLSPIMAQSLIREQSKLGVESRELIAPIKYSTPTTLTLQFMNSAMAEAAEMIPGVERDDDVTVSYSSEDYLEAFKCIRALLMIAGAL